ncbi:MAG: ferritin-like domain-containing protein [Gammaproteobacteria bacterium]
MDVFPSSRPRAELRRAAHAALLLVDPEEKVARVGEIDAACAAGDLGPDPQATLPAVLEPGRPARPVLVEARRVPRRKLASAEGRAALIHALAHIEFNAINLALDAVARFGDLPPQYYRDWMRIAGEEAHHYSLLAAHLRTLGCAYGDFPAHNGLWEAAAKTAGDVLARMGLVPRILEARGLDVTPGIQRKLRQAGDEEGAAILDIILRDEVGHVAVGNHWYRHSCALRGVAPEPMFARLLEEYAVSPPHPPFNEAARLRAGFSAEELAAWS